MIRSLLIHNSKIHEATVEKFTKHVVFVPSKGEIKSPSFDYDIYCHNELSKIFSNQDFDIIYISLSLSDFNYLEFGGLIVAHHIRVTKKWNHTLVPLVLIAQEDCYTINKLSSLGEILFTPGVYLEKNLLFELQRKKIISESDYIEKCLSRINIEPSSNYNSHHSIANEWALTRYFSMLKNDSQNPYYDKLSQKISQLDYTKSLHFKYSEARYKREEFKKDKHFYTPTIRNIKGKRIGIIDDEVSKGWGAFYEYLFRKSEAEAVIPFQEFGKSETKEALILKIQNWISNNYNSGSPIDIFIIDLRLHDDDFAELGFENLSGFQIIDYIKTKVNPGIQIVVLTASNKVWNFQKCLKLRVKYFAIKESPETFNNREDTKQNLLHLCEEISNAGSKTYLSLIYKSVNELKLKNRFRESNNQDEIEFRKEVFDEKGLLDNLYLSLDDDLFINNALLICFSILENYSEIYGIWEGSWKIFDKENTLVLNYVSSFPMTQFELVHGHFPDLMQNTDEGNKTLIGFDFYKVPQQRSIEKKRKATKATSIVKIALVLRFRECLSEDVINKLFKLKFIRNNGTAHYGNIKQGIKINHNDIVYFIEKIFQPIFN